MSTDYLHRAPFVRILIPFVAGIITGSFVKESILLFVFLMMLVLLLAIRIVNHQPGYIRNLWSGALTGMFFFLTGISGLLVRHRTEIRHDKPHYLATLLERPVAKAGSFRAEALLIHFGTDEAAGVGREKIIVGFEKDSMVAELVPGDRILFKRSPFPIRNQGNPYEFDYKGYMRHHGIERQVFLKVNEWKRAGSDNKFRLRVMAEKTRDKLLELYNRSGLEGPEFEILSALTLGYRKSLDQDILDAFKGTGSMHVLAVSGLHVGIIFVVFRFVFGFLRRKKAGRAIYLLLAVTGLWMYAFLTGLSPSVMRSALMFSVVLAGESLKRRSNIYNTLAASAFIMLTINPDLLSDVGFQLSYAAVTGIVYFQPRISSLVRPSSKIAGYFVDLLAVTISAQIATFPFTCFYFQQFPVYFWLANFFVVPGAFLFILMGVLILVGSPCPAVAELLAGITGWMVGIMFSLLQFIEDLPGSMITGFHFTAFSLAFSIGAILALVLFIQFRKSACLKGVVLMLSGFFLADALTKMAVANHSEVIVYRYPQPVVHLIAGRNNYLLAPGLTLAGDFPEWETKAVAAHFRLKEAVVVPLESDYSDRLLSKKGEIISFCGMYIRVCGRDHPACPTIHTDLIIVPPDSNFRETGDCKGTIVRYAHRSKNYKSLENNHFVWDEGVWRGRLRYR